MKRIKITFFLLIIGFTVLLCGSCRNRPGMCHDQADELVRCLNEHDEEGIMNLLCERIRTSDLYDFDKQIGDVFDLLGDRTIDVFDWQVGITQKSYREGKKTWERMNVNINKLELSDESNDIEEIIFLTTLVNEENPDLVGLSSIWVIVDDEEEYWIGESD